MAKALTNRTAASGYAKFAALSPADKERVWASFNREVPASEMRPLTTAERRLHARGGGPSKARADAQVVNVAVDRRLLRRADAYAKANGLTRAQLVANGLAAVIDAAAVARAPARRNGSATRPRRRKAS